MSKSKSYFRLDDSYSLDSQIESLRDVHEKHQLEKSMKMPRHIGYGEKSRSRDSSFYGAGSRNHEYHPWPLIEGIELNMWCAFDLLTVYCRVACLLLLEFTAAWSDFHVLGLFIEVFETFLASWKHQPKGLTKIPGNFPKAFLDSDDDDETSMNSSEIDGFAWDLKTLSL